MVENHRTLGRLCYVVVLPPDHLPLLISHLPNIRGFSCAVLVAHLIGKRTDLPLSSFLEFFCALPLSVHPYPLAVGVHNLQQVESRDRAIFCLADDAVCLGNTSLALPPSLIPAPFPHTRVVMIKRARLPFLRMQLSFPTLPGGFWACRRFPPLTISTVYTLKTSTSFEATTGGFSVRDP